MNVGQVIVRGILPLLVVGASLMGANRFIDSRPQPEKRARRERGLLVEVRKVRLDDHLVEVRAQGVVVPAQEIELAAEISGRVVWKNPELTVGGRLKKGEPMVRIDPRDYELAVVEQRAAVERAEAELQLEEARKRVAEEEWERFGKDQGGSPALATREPQLRSVELGLQTAKNQLAQAELTLDRTSVRAPFNAIVRTNATEVGRLVTPQQPIASLVASDVFLAEVSLKVDDLRWLSVPGVNRPLLDGEAFASLVEQGSEAPEATSLTSFAKVVQRAGAVEIERQGFVTRLLGELDPVGRMARLLVAIRDPLGAPGEHEGGPDPEQEAAEGPEGEGDSHALPLLLGAYVEVVLRGERLPSLIEIPRLALRDGDRVYVATAEDRLDMRSVAVVRRRQDSVLVGTGLGDGDRVIVSAMPSAVQGMELRVRDVTRSHKKRVSLDDQSSTLGVRR